MPGAVHERRSHVDVLQSQLERAGQNIQPLAPEVRAPATAKQGAAHDAPTVEKGGKLSVALGVLKHRAPHTIAEAASKQHGALGLLGRAALPLLQVHTAIEFGHMITGKPELTADEQQRYRNTYGLAIAKLGEGALPRGYLESISSSPHADARLADAMLAQMHRKMQTQLKTPEHAEVGMRVLQQVARQSTGEGVEWAAAFGLRNEQDLKALLGKDRSFAARFSEDLAFQNGVKSMVWLAKTRPQEWESHRQLAEHRGAGVR
jgi:hypothetical protein